MIEFLDYLNDNGVVTLLLFGFVYMVLDKIQDIVKASRARRPIQGPLKFPRDEVAGILEIVARDGLDGPRDLDVALDAIQCTVNMVTGEEDDEDD